jgi:hypothetical protein
VIASWGRGKRPGVANCPAHFSALQPHGKIIVAGAAWNGEASQIELMRFR